MVHESHGLQHLPQEECTYLFALRDALLSALGADQVLQICVIGSASYPSGYLSGQSDLDVTVVSRSRLEDSTLARIPELCSHAVLPCPAQKLELVVYAYEAVHLDRPALPYSISLNYNTGKELPQDHIRYGNNPDDSPHWFILDIAAGHKNNLPLLDGPPFSDIFTPQLGRRQMLEALETSIQWHIEYEATSANAVLKACRGWRWADEGVFGSKLEGGRYALDRLSHESEQAGQKKQALQTVQTAMDVRIGSRPIAAVGTIEGEALYALIKSELRSALALDPHASS